MIALNSHDNSLKRYSISKHHPILNRKNPMQHRNQQIPSPESLLLRWTELFNEQNKNDET